MNANVFDSLPHIDHEIDYDLDQELRRGRRDGSLIAAKQRMLYEFITIPAIAAMIQDAAAPYAVRADLAKFSAKLAGEGIDKPLAPVSAFHLAINLPGDGQPAVITGEVITPLPAPEAHTGVEVEGIDPINFDPLAFTPDYVGVRFPLVPDLCMSTDTLARLDC
jgi:hypothetical protein